MLENKILLLTYFSGTKPEKIRKVTVLERCALGLGQIT